MTIKKIRLTAKGARPRKREPIRFGIPLSRGELFNPKRVRLYHPSEGQLPAQCRTLTYWPDGSCKWILIDGMVDHSGSGTEELSLRVDGEEGVGEDEEIEIYRSREGFLNVNTGACKFWIGDPKDNLLSGSARGSSCGIIECSLLLKTENDTSVHPVIQTVTMEESGPLRTIFLIKGSIQLPANKKITFFCRIHIFTNSSLIALDMTIRNPGAAIHPEGIWDLGDPGSVFFKGLSLEVTSSNDNVQGLIAPATGMQPFSLNSNEDLMLYQESSGGTAWDSPAHRNRKGIVPMTHAGYQVFSGECLVSEGRRSQPTAWIGYEREGIGIAVPKFWQNFPKSIRIAPNKMIIGFFPEKFPDLFELQGGEQKTYKLFLDFSVDPEGMDWVHSPIQVIPDSNVYKSSHAVPWLFGDDHEHERISNLEPLRVIRDPWNLFAKRELCDEFGWRHFGEIYADHEAVYHTGVAPFISHYNNQYDLLFSSYRQFMNTGEPMWWTIADELAEHIVDIDLYHTDDDREEYNHGLFWHTDHYLDAGTATHRSFSKFHLQYKNSASCGGGPGAQHCYTTGLLYYYLMTGNAQAKDAVLALADWAIRSLGGDESVVVTLNRIRELINHWRNSGAGVIFPRYPLTRGTGNTITACLDAFEIGHDRKYLDFATEFIRGTVHPDDNVDDRDLLNAEKAWSYTVFLAAVGKYLDYKWRLGELDKDFHYARSSLTTYADWMVSHEYLYLDKAEILEYPNETWAAQDLRKPVIFYYAARFSDTGRAALYRERAEYFWSRGMEQLSRHNTYHLARPTALVLQNEWVASRRSEDFAPVGFFDEPRGNFGPATPDLNLMNLIRRSIVDLVRSFRNTTLQRELAWLRVRFR
jgi:PcRGLX-like N-terminal RIFT barrel domain